jgi:hypothetical protein
MNTFNIFDAVEIHSTSSSLDGKVLDLWKT